jgi:ubiquitin carboxyl-terminal hydrolase MINDY-1/2
MIAEFLASSSHQLTFYGLLKLHELKENSFSVFFRNNHFSTLHKHNGEVRQDLGYFLIILITFYFHFKKKLYLLATDLGFLKEPKIVWEKLSEIDGNKFEIRVFIVVFF